MNFFDDVFHRQGDDDDMGEDETIDFDDFKLKMESKSEIQVLHEEEEEVEHLSQQLATTLESPVVTVKKFKIDTNITDEHLPSYLKRKYQRFDQLMVPLLQRYASSTSMTLEDLRDMANALHHLNLTKLMISEWEMYLQSGTGELKVFFPQQQKFVMKSKPLIWPNEVKKTMLKEGAINAQRESDIDDQYCLSFVKDYLRRCQTDLYVWQSQLNEWKENLGELPDEMYQTMERYISEQYMNEQELRIQKNMALTEYNYRDRLLELEFEELKPNEEQLNLYRKSYQIKTDYEKSQANVKLLKQHVHYQKFPESFDSFQLPVPVDIESIQDLSLRATLDNRYQRIVHQSKLELMNLHIGVAEAKMRQCQHDLNQQNELVKASGWKKEMIHLLQRRFKDYEDRIQRIYNLKLNFFVKAPTVVEKNM